MLQNKHWDFKLDRIAPQQSPASPPPTPATTFAPPSLLPVTTLLMKHLSPYSLWCSDFRLVAAMEAQELSHMPSSLATVSLDDRSGTQSCSGLASPSGHSFATLLTGKRSLQAPILLEGENFHGSVECGLICLQRIAWRPFVNLYPLFKCCGASGDIHPWHACFLVVSDIAKGGNCGIRLGLCIF